jgi:hypothetical protein
MAIRSITVVFSVDKDSLQPLPHGLSGVERGHSFRNAVHAATHGVVLTLS